MKPVTTFKFLIAAIACLSAAATSAAVVKVDAAVFGAGSGLITFSEFAVNTVNPVYAPVSYGASAASPTVTFGGYFTGQSLSTNPLADCPDGAATACVAGAPTGPLSLDAASAATFITLDGANPTAPVLTGSPRFDGSVAIFFDADQSGVGLEGGYFDMIGATAITAFARDGSVLGMLANAAEGMEFLGLATDDGSARIAGLLFSISGGEPGGFAIDNLRFGTGSQIVLAPADVPEPASLALLGLGLIGVRVARRRK